MSANWVEENARRAAEFRFWACKAREAGLETLANQFEEAAAALDRAADALGSAQQVPPSPSTKGRTGT